MKKILSLIICITLLGGCGNFKIKEDEIEPLNFSGFNCYAYTENNGIKISTNVIYKEYENMEFLFDMPESFENTSIICDEEKIYIDMNNLKCEYPLDKLPYNMICKIIKKCVDNVLYSKLEDDGEFLISQYEDEGHLCTLYLDRQTRNFVKLNIDKNEKIYFDEFNYT